MDNIIARRIAVIGVGYQQIREFIQWVGEFPNLLVTRTFSKAFGLAGLRIGYGISHRDIADLMNRVRQPFNVFISSQVPVGLFGFATNIRREFSFIAACIAERSCPQFFTGTTTAFAPTACVTRG